VKNLQAYILVTTKPVTVRDIAEAVLKIGRLGMAQAVTGSYDVIAFVEASKLDTLSDILGKILSIRGLLHTQTVIVMSERL
jgi:hypothetical protein